MTSDVFIFYFIAINPWFTVCFYIRCVSYVCCRHLSVLFIQFLFSPNHTKICSPGISHLALKCIMSKERMSTTKRLRPNPYCKYPVLWFHVTIDCSAKNCSLWIIPRKCEFKAHQKMYLLFFSERMTRTLDLEWPSVIGSCFTSLLGNSETGVWPYLGAASRGCKSCQLVIEFSEMSYTIRVMNKVRKRKKVYKGFIH